MSLLEGWLNEIVSNFQPPRLVTSGRSRGMVGGFAFLSGGSLSLGSLLLSERSKDSMSFILSLGENSP